MQDPFGHMITVPPALLSGSKIRTLHQIREVVTSPSYMIRVHEEALYFFRLLDWDVNILVEAEAENGSFVVKSCSQNPSTEYISGLLKKGGLIAFR